MHRVITATVLSFSGLENDITGPELVLSSGSLGCQYLYCTLKESRRNGRLYWPQRLGGRMLRSAQPKSSPKGGRNFAETFSGGVRGGTHRPGDAGPLYSQCTQWVMGCWGAEVAGGCPLKASLEGCGGLSSVSGEGTGAPAADLGWLQENRERARRVSWKKKGDACDSASDFFKYPSRESSPEMESKSVDAAVAVLCCAGWSLHQHPNAK